MVSIHSTTHLQAYALLKKAVNEGQPLPDERPEMGALYNSIFCTGSIISKYLVLTAAHWSATVMTPLRNIVSWMLSKDL